MRYLIPVMSTLWLVSCGGSNRGTTAAPTQVALPESASVTLKTFGYAAITCDLDDPFDDTDKTDYADEVSSFTNANLICLGPEPSNWAMRLRQSREQFTPVLLIEPAFFEFTATGGQLLTDYEVVWGLVRQAIQDANIQDGEIIFYLADEPALRNLPPDALSVAAKSLKADFPDSKILVVEAYQATGLPVIPSEIDWWAFNAYTIADPAQDSRYTNYLNLAKSRLSGNQDLVLIMDGIHTPFHLQAGLSETDMAEVAQNYFNYAKARNDIAAIFVYTWAGGIDNIDEKGVRDLPQSVQDKHKEIGKAITGL